jgi:hypothetical protein
MDDPAYMAAAYDLFYTMDGYHPVSVGQFRPSV